MTALLHALAPYSDALLFVAAMLFLLLADSLWGDRIRARLNDWLDGIRPQKSVHFGED